MRMLTSLQLSIQTLTALTIFYLMLLPSCLTMSVISKVRALDQFNDIPSFQDSIHISNLEKKERGNDPWNICPYGISQVACFDLYVEAYSRMRKQVVSSNGRQIIGKRLSRTSY